MKNMMKCWNCQFHGLDDPRKVEKWMDRVMGGQFVYRWRKSGKKVEDVPFRHVHPDVWRRWIAEGPCRGCPCAPHCDEICALRAAWWDDRMELLRRKLGM